MTKKTPVTRAASRSDVQQLVERLMISELSKNLGLTLTKAVIPLGPTRVSVDGFHHQGGQVVIAEAWAHVGTVKAAQRNKVHSDILKLALLRAAFRRSDSTLKIRCLFVLADSTSASRFKTERSWTSVAAREFGIEPHVVALPSQTIETIREAQRRQDIRTEDGI